MGENMIDTRKLNKTQIKFLQELAKAMTYEKDLSVFRSINLSCNAICPTVFSQKMTNFHDIANALAKYNKIRGR